MDQFESFSATEIAQMVGTLALILVTIGVMLWPSKHGGVRVRKVFIVGVVSLLTLGFGVNIAKHGVFSIDPGDYVGFAMVVGFFIYGYRMADKELASLPRANSTEE